MSENGEKIEMALETEVWLGPCFMEKILRKSEGDNSIQVVDMISKQATSKGDNYTSDMVRITVEFSRDKINDKIEKKSIIVKISPVEGPRQKIVKELNCFYTEGLMMSDTLDKMNKLLEPKYRLSGKILHIHNGNSTFLMIEDLAPLGFRMADRISGLDLAHSVLAIQALARFHATSVFICEKEPKQKKIYSTGMFYKNNPQVKDIFTQSTEALAEEIANWPEMKKYSGKIAKLSDRIYQMGIDAIKLSEDEFNVINHGDFHVNNMLFKYDDDGNPTDHICVDFQMSVYASPALDLLYFFNSSLSLDVIEDKRHILLNEYLGILMAIMKQLNCKTQPPTMEELKAVLKRKVNLEMIISFVVLPFMLCCKSEAKNIDEIVSIGTFRHPGIKSESYKKIMLKRLPIFDEWGLLDL